VAAACHVPSAPGVKRTSSVASYRWRTSSSAVQAHIGQNSSGMTAALDLNSGVASAQATLV
jgi:hypothetical protein